MGFDNKFFVGVNDRGYSFALPPRNPTDEEVIELVALLIAMKPLLKDRFFKRIKELMGEG